MLADALALAAALGAFLVAGYAILALLTASGRPADSYALRTALAFALGVAAVAVELFVASWVFERFPRPLAIVLPWIALAGFAFVRSRRRPAAGSTRTEPPLALPQAVLDPAILLLGAIVLASVVTVYVLAIERPTWNYDALSRWMFKAKAFFAEGSILPYFEDAERGVTQPHYPPLVSLGVTWIYLVLGREDDRLAKVFFVAVHAALLLGCYGLARRRVHAACALAGTAALAIVPALTWLDFPPGVAAHAELADVPLALFTLLAVGIAIDGARDRDRADFRAFGIAGLLAGGAWFTKQEGAIVAITVAGIALFAAIRRRGASVRNRLAPLAAGLLGLAIASPWLVFERGIPLTDDVWYPEVMTLDHVIANATRIPVIAARFLSELASFERFGAFYLLAALAFALAPRAASRNGSLAVVIVVLLHVAAYGVIYVIDDFLGEGAYEMKMDISLTRLFLHFAPLAALIIAWQAQALLMRRDDGNA